MKQKNFRNNVLKNRVIALLEIYENNDSFEERAKYLENSPLSISDELREGLIDLSV